MERNCDIHVKNVGNVETTCGIIANRIDSRAYDSRISHSICAWTSSSNGRNIKGLMLSDVDDKAKYTGKSTAK